MLFFMPLCLPLFVLLILLLARTFIARVFVFLIFFAIFARYMCLLQCRQQQKYEA